MTGLYLSIFLMVTLLILFGSLPPAVLNFMVAEQFEQEPGKVASIVLIGHLVAIVFVPLGLTIALRPSTYTGRSVTPSG